MDLIDIIIIAYLIYLLIKLVKETRAEQLVKGIIFLVVFTQISQWFQLNTVYFILRNTMQVGLLALLIVFQPELRRALEKMGTSKIKNVFSFDSNSDVEIEDAIEQICSALVQMSHSKTGALIVIELGTKMGDIIRTGILLDSYISEELLVNIFVPNTPLHDGAVVVQGNKIRAAACFLPLSKSEDVSMELGTRHRAALGVTENADAVALIVSEETGKISYAYQGQLKIGVSKFDIKRLLENTMKSDASSKKKGRRVKNA